MAVRGGAGAILLALSLSVVRVASGAEANWPLSPEAGARLAELRAILGDPATTPAARDAARTEMLRMILANPDAPPPKKMPPRAAAAVPVDPLVNKPEAAKAAPAAPPATRVAPPVAPMPPLTVPGTGAVLQPQGAGYVDPVTGRFYQPVPGGYVDPATGRFVAKP
jgi:hypothetical protein